MEDVLCLDTAPLVAAPIFPNSVRWSEENLLAAAAGHLVTIMSPSSLSGPRGYITLPRGPEKDIGEIQNEDLTKQSVLPLRLRKEVQTRVRSIDWSPQGFAPDGGCLLAVCTSAHDVKIFRRPASELTSEWIEAADISALYHEHCTATSFADAAPGAVEYAKNDAVPLPDAEWQFRRGWQTKTQAQGRQPKAPSQAAPPKTDPPRLGRPPSKSKKRAVKTVLEKEGGAGAGRASAEGKGEGLVTSSAEGTLKNAEAQKRVAGSGIPETGGAWLNSGTAETSRLREKGAKGQENRGQWSEPLASREGVRGFRGGGAQPQGNAFAAESWGVPQAAGILSTSEMGPGGHFLGMEGRPQRQEGVFSEGLGGGSEVREAERLRSGGGGVAPTFSELVAGAGRDDFLFGESLLPGVDWTDLPLDAEMDLDAGPVEGKRDCGEEGDGNEERGTLPGLELGDLAVGKGDHGGGTEALEEQRALKTAAPASPVLQPGGSSLEKGNGGNAEPVEERRVSEPQEGKRLSEPLVRQKVSEPKKQHRASKATEQQRLSQAAGVEKASGGTQNRGKRRTQDANLCAVQRSSPLSLGVQISDLSPGEVQNIRSAAQPEKQRVFDPAGPAVVGREADSVVGQGQESRLQSYMAGSSPRADPGLQLGVLLPGESRNAGSAAQREKQRASGEAGPAAVGEEPEDTQKGGQGDQPSQDGELAADASAEASPGLRPEELLSGETQGKNTGRTEQTEEQRNSEAADPAGAGVEAEIAPKRGRGKRRTRDADLAADASPRVTGRRSTRQRVARSHSWVKEGLSEGGPHEEARQDGRGNTGGAPERERRRGRRRKRLGETEDQVAGTLDGAQETASGAEADAAGSSERGGAGVTVGVNGLDGGTGREDAGGENAEGPEKPLLSSKDMEPGAIVPVEDKSGAAMEDTPLGKLPRKGGRQPSRGKSKRLYDSDSGSEPTSHRTKSKGAPAWQLGAVSAPVVSSRDIILGSRVEVLQVEEGLRGAWYAGTVVKLGGRGKAQVEYDELLENEETGEKLREWVPLQPVPTVGVGELQMENAKPDARKRTKVTKRRRGKRPGKAVKEEQSEEPAVAMTRTAIRPRVRPEVSRIEKEGQAYAPGNRVDAFLGDAWWEGLVVGCTETGAASVFFPGDGDMQDFGPEKLRLAWEFRGLARGWSPFGSVEDAPEKTGPRKTRVTKGVKRGATKKANGDDASDETGPRKKRVTGRFKQKDELVQTGPRKRRVTKRVTREGTEGDDSEEAVLRKAGVKVGVKGSRKRKKTEAKVAGSSNLKTPKIENEPEYELPPVGTEERAQILQEQERLARALCGRFRALREKEPAEALPEYKEGEHLKGRDKELLEEALAEMVAQEGDLLAAAKLSVRELVKLGRRHIRVKVVKSRKTPKREPRVVPKLEPDLVPGAEQQGGVPGPRKRKRVDYAKLVGEGEYGERKEREKGEPSKKKRKRKQPDEGDADFVPKSGADGEEDLDPSAEKLAKKKKGGPRQLTEEALEKRRAQERERARRKSEALKATKLLSQVKVEHAPGPKTVPAAVFAARSDLLAALTVAWSPRCPGRTPAADATILVVGAMSGHVTLWKVSRPLDFSATQAGATAVTFLGTLRAHDSWVSALGWAYREGPAGAVNDAGATLDGGRESSRQGLLYLATGSSDGSVRLWSLELVDFTESGASGGPPLVIERVAQVCAPSGEVVSSLSLQLERGVLKVAVAKGAGELLIWKGLVPASPSTEHSTTSPTVISTRPSGQPLMGLGWSADGDGVFTCTQEGSLQKWQLAGETGLLPITLQVTKGDPQLGLSVPPASLMRGYTGLAVSPNGLAIAGVRTLALGSLDTMYQAKAMRGALQVVLCGRGSGSGVKPGRRPRGTLSAAAEAAIRTLSGVTDGSRPSRDWIEEFLPCPVALTTESPSQAKAGKSDSQDVVANENGQKSEEEAQAVAGEARVEDERKRSSAERLRKNVVRSVESVLGQDGPIVLWDVIVALKELDADALQQVLEVARKAAGGKVPENRGSLERNRQQSGGEERTGGGKEPGLESSPGEGNRTARGREPGPGQGSQGGGLATSGESGVPRVEIKGHGGNERDQNGTKNPHSERIRSAKAERKVRRALQVLHVLLQKLGRTLVEEEETEHSGRNRASQPRFTGVSGGGFMVGVKRDAERSGVGTTQGDTRGKELAGNQCLTQAQKAPGAKGRALPGWEIDLEQVETELRVQLAQASLSRLKKIQGPVTGADATSPLLWADWLRAKGTEAGPRVKQLAENLYEVCGVRPPLEGGLVSWEACPLCSSPVPLDSPDTAHCSYTGLPGSSSALGVKGHKFKRCMITMLICTSPSTWQCSCCLRTCSKALFESAQSPLCIFCGMLMHRPLPEALLRPALC